jgi:hypothetical protein
VIEAAVRRRSISACCPPASVTATIPGLTAATFSSVCRRLLPGASKEELLPLLQHLWKLAWSFRPATASDFSLRVPPDAYRISKGERYTADFHPAEDLQPDDAAVLIYSAKSVEGEKVRDLSGHGNDGWVERL